MPPLQQWRLRVFAADMRTASTVSVPKVGKRKHTFAPCLPTVLDQRPKHSGYMGWHLQGSAPQLALSSNICMSASVQEHSAPAVTAAQPQAMLKHPQLQAALEQAPNSKAILSQLQALLCAMQGSKHDTASRNTSRYSNNASSRGNCSSRGRPIIASGAWTSPASLHAAIAAILDAGTPSHQPLRSTKTHQRGVKALVLCPSAELLLRCDAAAMSLLTTDEADATATLSAAPAIPVAAAAAAAAAAGSRAVKARLPRCASLSGGASRAQEVSALRQVPDVVFATPGRCLAHLTDEAVDLRSLFNGLQLLVLLDAEALLAPAMRPTVERIQRLLSPQDTATAAQVVVLARSAANADVTSYLQVSLAGQQPLVVDAWGDDSVLVADVLPSQPHAEAWSQTTADVEQQAGERRLALQDPEQQPTVQQHQQQQAENIMSAMGSMQHSIMGLHHGTPSIVEVQGPLVVPVTIGNHLAELYRLIRSHASGRHTCKVLVCFRSANEARLCAKLFKVLGVAVMELHARRTLPYRASVLHGFAAQSRAVLFTTAAAERACAWPDLTLRVGVGASVNASEVQAACDADSTPSRSVQLVFEYEEQQWQRWQQQQQQQQRQQHTQALQATMDLSPLTAQPSETPAATSLRTVPLAQQRRLQEHVRGALRRVRHATKAAAYTAWLSYHLRHRAQYGWSMPQTVQAAAEYAAALGCSSPPPLRWEAACKMGVQDMAGIVTTGRPTRTSTMDA